MLEQIRRFFSPEAGQSRRQGIASLDERASEALRYYLGPTGIPERLAAVNEIFNPIVHGEQAGQDTRRALDASLPAGERLSAMFAQSSGADRGPSPFVNHVVHPWVDGVFPQVPERPVRGSDDPRAVFHFEPETIDRVTLGLRSLGVPTPGRLYTRAMMGDERPVGAEAFTEDELAVIRELAARSLADRDRGSVQYEDYNAVDATDRLRGVETRSGEGIAGLMGGSPAARMETTLGRFVTYRDEDGTLRVVDQYNFNPNHSRAEARQQLIQMLLQSTPRGRFPPPERNFYDALRIAGEAYGPRGRDHVSGMPIELQFLAEEE